MKIEKTYDLDRGVSNDVLKKNGFKNGTFRCYIYKDIIQLIIRIDAENKWWDYKVFDTNTDLIYAQYYIRNYGRNEIVKELDEKIENIFKEMERENIFIRMKGCK